MLYDEFVKGTGCRETDYNYQVYKELEIIYMNTDCSKEHIYEMGRKLVDNSKTEEEIELENKIKAEIEGYKRYIAELKEEIERFEECVKTEEDKVWKKTWRDKVHSLKDEVKRTRGKIQALRWVLS